jgi:inosine-uridine nucleoside N-ribohydrolase
LILRPALRGWLFGSAGGSVPQNVILDVDLAFDLDDVYAVMLALQAHEEGRINLLGIVVSSALDSSAPGLYGILAGYATKRGFPFTDIPIAAYQGSTGSYSEVYTEEVRERFGVSGQSRTAYTDDVDGYRTWLEAAETPVKIITVGGQTSFAALLASSADGISALTGSQLVAAKVSECIVMGGAFPGPGSAEANYARDKTATKYVMDNCPVPVIHHGFEVGNTVLYMPPPGVSPLLSPGKYATDIFATNMADGDRHKSWDLLAVHYAIYGPRSAYEMGGEDGTDTVVEATGINTWSATPGNHSYVEKVSSDAALAEEVDALLFEFENCSRVNKLCATDDFTRTEWTKNRLTIGTKNADGMDQIIETTDTGTHHISGTTAPVKNGKTYVISIEAKQDANIRYVQLYAAGAAFGFNAWGNFDLQSGALGTIGSAATGFITPVDGRPGVYRIGLIITATANLINANFNINSVAASDSARGAAHTGSTSDRVYIGKPQFEEGSAFSAYEANP